MAVPYPSDELPPPSLDGYQLNPGQTFERSDLASGRAIQREGFGSVPTRAPVQWMLNQAELMRFEGWFFHEIRKGVSWFEGPMKTGIGIRDYKLRFRSMYQAVPSGPYYWIVSAELEIREHPVIERDWILYAPAYVRWASIFDVAMNREWPPDQ